MTKKNVRLGFVLMLGMALLLGAICNFASGSIGSVIRGAMVILLYGSLLVFVLLEQKQYARFLMLVSFAFIIVGNFLDWGGNIDTLINLCRSSSSDTVLKGFQIARSGIDLISAILLLIVAVLCAMQSNVRTLKNANTTIQLLLVNMVLVSVSTILLIVILILSKQGWISYLAGIQNIFAAGALAFGYAYYQESGLSR